MPGIHSILPPSSAKSWTRCTASVGYCLDNESRIPPDRGSVYAQEGTTAHDWAEKILNGVAPDSALPAEFSPVMDYVRTCRAIINRWDKGTTLVETKVPLFYLASQNGTVDFAHLCDDGLHIRDLKYGSGVPVEAEGNEQLAIYAQSLIVELASMFDLRDDLPVTLGVVQPRYIGGDIEKIWTTTIRGLREFCIPIAEAAASILSGLAHPDVTECNRDLVFAPGEDTCRWCKAKAFCTARAASAFEEVMASTALTLDGFDCEDDKPLPLPSPTTGAVWTQATLTEQQVVNIVRRSKELHSFIASCEDYLMERAVAGKPVPGTKLVAGRQGNRAWTDEAAAASLLSSDLALSEREIFDLKVKSPTKISELLKGKPVDLALIAPLITRTPGKPVLTFSDDKRPAIAPPTDGFEAIENPDDD